MSDTATPMLAQYLELKAEAGDALLFYRMGDFYELFFADAAAAAATLGITLTRRGRYRGEDVPMCGVPVHAAQAYLARLIRAGHRVAVAEQTEDAATARRAGRPVARAIVRVASAATLTEEELLDATAANWLMCVIVAGERAGAAWVDVSTGRFLTAAVDRVDEAALRARVAPAELIGPDSAPGVTSVPGARFDIAGARARLELLFGVATVDTLGAFEDVELRAAGGLLAYLEHGARGHPPRLDPPERVVATHEMAIDAATRASLDLGRGGLLGRIDRTRTAGGARLLADDLAAPLVDLQALQARHDAVGWFVTLPRLRARVRDALRAVPDVARALGRLGAGRGQPRDLAAIGTGLAQADAIAAMLADGSDAPQSLAATLAGLTLERALAAAIVHALALADDRAAAGVATLDEGGFIAPGYDPALDVLRHSGSGARATIAGLETRYREASGVAGLRIRHNGVLGWHIDAPARAETALRGAGFVHRQTLSGQVRFGSDELTALATQIADAANAALALERAHFERLCAMVLESARAVGAVAGALARIDVTAALAELAAGERWVRPDMDVGTTFAIEGARHPVVEAALATAHKPFVANDCDLTDRPLWLVTGPNMGGKSTFLRQTALIAILAQMGSFVPARAARLGIVDRLFSRVGASDDLAQGRSTFMVEMIETATILRQATPRSLVILDELGRGTSTYDGLAIAWAVLEWIHDRIGCRCLFATHYHELTRLARRLDGVHLATLRAREWKGELLFLHEVAAGAADRSYGLAVARLAGVPPPVIARAKAILARLEAGRPMVQIEGELPLFGPAAQAEPLPPDMTGQTLIEALRDIDPDALSPRDAHALVRTLVGRIHAE